MSAGLDRAAMLARKYKRARAIDLAKKYPAQYRVWLAEIVGTFPNDFLCELLNSPSELDLAEGWMEFLKSAPFAEKEGL